MLTLNDSPANILRWLLVSLGSLADPTILSATSPFLPTGNWPGYDSVEPDLPDNCVTIYDTEGQHDGRGMVDGQVYYHYGCQLRIRSIDQPTGWSKAWSLHETLARTIFMNPITVNGTNYLIHCVADISAPIRLGQDSPNSRRYLHTVNCLLALSYA